VSLRTHSRSAYLGVGLGLMLLVWYYRRRWYLLIAALPLIGYAVVHQPRLVTARLESVWTGRTPEGYEDRSIQSRLEQMRTAMRVITSNPLLGIGPRQYFLQYEEYVSREDAHGGSYTMHSVPLLILCEEGLLGFFVFYALIVLGVLRDAAVVARRARADPALAPTAIVAAGAAMGFLAWLAYGLAQPQMWVINVWGTLALVAASRRVADAQLAESVIAEEGQPQVARARPASLPARAQTEIVFS
jgi:O-antigen ligase